MLKGCKYQAYLVHITKRHISDRLPPLHCGARERQKRILILTSKNSWYPFRCGLASSPLYERELSFCSEKVQKPRTWALITSQYWLPKKCRYMIKNICKIPFKFMEPKIHLHGAKNIVLVLYRADKGRQAAHRTTRMHRCEQAPQKCTAFLVEKRKTKRDQTIPGTFTSAQKYYYYDVIKRDQGHTPYLTE